MADDKDIESPIEDAPFSEPPATSPRRSGGVLAAFSLLIAVAAAGGSAWTWWQFQQFEPPAVELPDLPDLNAELSAFRADQDAALQALRRQIDDQLRSSRSSLVDEIRAEGDQAARRADDLASTWRRDQAGLERRLAAVEDGVARLAQHGLGSERALGVAEAEFLLRLAGERLTLFSDPAGAAEAMRLADDQLKALDDPLYAGVRQALAAEIQALESVESADRVAISGRLLQLAAASPEWPLDARRSLRAEGPNLLEPEQTEAGWWARLKAVAASVVVVHRDQTDATVLLTLEEERLLRENVQLQLQVAQLAAVRGEQSLYAAAIGLVRDWLTRYYDPQSSQVAEALKTLAELERIALDVPMPEINQALRRLRNLRATSAVAEEQP